MTQCKDDGEDNKDRRNHNASMERRAQTVIQAIILALVLFVGSSIIKTREDIVELRVNDLNRATTITSIQNELATIRSNSATAAAAAVTAAAALATASGRRGQESR